MGEPVSEWESVIRVKERKWERESERGTVKEIHVYNRVTFAKWQLRTALSEKGM